MLPKFKIQRGKAFKIEMLIFTSRVRSTYITKHVLEIPKLKQTLTHNTEHNMAAY